MELTSEHVQRAERCRITYRIVQDSHAAVSGSPFPARAGIVSVLVGESSTSAGHLRYRPPLQLLTDLVTTSYKDFKGNQRHA